jgi:hypothetical protein
MNPEKWTLAQARIDDAVEACEIFTLLTGEQFELRRKLIEGNALDVKNLGVWADLQSAPPVYPPGAATAATVAAPEANSSPCHWERAMKETGDLFPDFDRQPSLFQTENQTVHPASPAPVEESISLPSDTHDWPLERIELSVRLRGVLRRLGCKRLGDLHGLTWRQVAKTRNCGRKTLTELQSVVVARGGGEELCQASSATRPAGDDVIRLPDYARRLPLNALPQSVRLAGIFRSLQCCVLGDLEGRRLREIRDLKNCGRKTLRELERLLERARAGEFSYEAGGEAAPDLPHLILALNLEIGSLPARESEILLARFGGTGQPPVTLEELGSAHGLTRERVRQIEEKVRGRLTRGFGPRGQQVLGAFVGRCLTECCPLTPEVLRHWMGAESGVCRFPLAFYVRLLGALSPSLPVWPDGQRGDYYRSERARQILHCLRAVVVASSPAVPLGSAFRQLEAALPGVTAAEVLAALKHYEPLAVEVSSPGQPQLRLSSPRTREWARLVLTQSDRALLPEEIIVRAAEMLGEAFEPISAFTLANVLRPDDGFYLLDRRTFGMRQHFRFPAHHWERAREDCLTLLGRENRPVSTAEIVNERRFAWAAEVTPHELAQILREDSRFIDLGRFLFALGVWGVRVREYLGDLIPKVLAQIGRPANLKEILKQLRQQRSITPTAIPYALRTHSEVSDYGYGYYGLKAWGEAEAVRHLIEEPLFINRAVAGAEQPLTFGDLCQRLSIPTEGKQASQLWQTIQALPKVRKQPNQMTATTRLTHKRWALKSQA